MMSELFHIQNIALALSLLLGVLIVDLIRRRKLNIEYSIGWMLASLTIFLFALPTGLIEWVTEIVGGTLWTSTLFFFGFLFLILICISFSVRISTLTNQVRVLASELAIISLEVERQTARKG